MSNEGVQFGEVTFWTTEMSFELIAPNWVTPNSGIASCRELSQCLGYERILCQGIPSSEARPSAAFDSVRLVPVMIMDRTPANLARSMTKAKSSALKSIRHMYGIKTNIIIFVLLLAIIQPMKDRISQVDCVIHCEYPLLREVPVESIPPISTFTQY